MLVQAVGTATAKAAFRPHRIQSLAGAGIIEYYRRIEGPDRFQVSKTRVIQGVQSRGVEGGGEMGGQKHAQRIIASKAMKASKASKVGKASNVTQGKSGKAGKAAQINAKQCKATQGK